MTPPTKQNVVAISILWMIGGILGLVQNFMVLSDQYLVTVDSSAQFAIAINSITIAITFFGLIVVSYSKSAQLVKIFSGLFILVVIVHIIYSVYFFIIVSSNDVLYYYLRITIFQFIASLLGIYFAKIIVDYSKVVEFNQNNVQTPTKVEAPNVTDHQ
ncbi:24616_t:CDS:2, partial [Gigaspora rosea]